MHESEKLELVNLLIAEYVYGKNVITGELAADASGHSVEYYSPNACFFCLLGFTLRELDPSGEEYGRELNARREEVASEYLASCYPGGLYSLVKHAHKLGVPEDDSENLFVWLNDELGRMEVLEILFTMKFYLEYVMLEDDMELNPGDIIDINGGLAEFLSYDEDGRINVKPYHGCSGIVSYPSDKPYSVCVREINLETVDFGTLLPDIDI